MNINEILHNDQKIKPVKGYEQYYGATIDGRIFSFNYRHKEGRLGELAQTIRTDKRRKEKTKYRRVKASKIKRNTPVDVHRLVALAWIPNPENKPQVNHKDGDKSNNHASNLEWCTVKENVRHAESNGLAIHASGENHPRAKLSADDVIKIIKILNESNERGIGRKLAEEYGVSVSVISNINVRRTWRCLNVD